LVSTLPASCREELEDLLFFHPDQGRFRKTITDSVERFGAPSIVSHPQGQGLAVAIGSLGPVQSLFALVSTAGTDEELAGVVLFLRTAPDLIEVLHIVVATEYQLQARRTGPAVAIELIEAVRTAARRIRGVERICLHYGRGRPVYLRVR